MKDFWFVISLYGSVDAETQEEAEANIQDFLNTLPKEDVVVNNIRIGDQDYEITHIGEYDEDGRIIS